MKVGTICKLKVDCLGNKAGSLGVVFNDYGDGFQVIFENGGYDGFSRTSIFGKELNVRTEADRFLEEVGFEVSLAAYPFKNVMQVSEDYRTGTFNKAWGFFWQKASEQIDQAVARAEARAEAEAKPAEYEKCEICVEEDGRKPWLYFKREAGGTVEVLSAAMDYADFSHFEYAKMEKSLQPRWFYGKETIYPLYVVFRKVGNSND